MKTDLLFATVMPLTYNQTDGFSRTLECFFAVHNTYSIQLLSQKGRV
jgi:hypothetical protein